MAFPLNYFVVVLSSLFFSRIQFVVILPDSPSNKLVACWIRKVDVLIVLSTFSCLLPALLNGLHNLAIQIDFFAFGHHAEPGVFRSLSNFLMILLQIEQLFGDVFLTLICILVLPLNDVLHCSLPFAQRTGCTRNNNSPDRTMVDIRADRQRAFRTACSISSL